MFVATKRRSESPLGLTMPIASERLLAVRDPSDAERIMMEIWERENARHNSINFGIIPLDYITHRCTEKCVPGENGDIKHLFSAKFDEHDKKIVAAAVQWLATNSGRAVLYEFFRVLELRQRAQREQNSEEALLSNKRKSAT